MEGEAVGTMTEATLRRQLQRQCVQTDRHFDTSYYGAFNNQQMPQASMEYKGELTTEGGVTITMTEATLLSHGESDRDSNGNGNCDSD
jgi:hypothetical protein